MHPFINRPAKGALRWYPDPKHLTRNSKACRQEGELCPFALDWPSWQILPFQFAVFGGNAAVPVSCGMYTLDGELAYDLTGMVSMLTVELVSAPGPERRVITSDAPILLDYIMAGGLYELRIGLADGRVMHSETIKVHCDLCSVVDGVFGRDTLVIGRRYLYRDGLIATYCGMNCSQPVDLDGFNNFEACDGGRALVVNLSKWGEWVWDADLGQWRESREMPCFHKLEWRGCGDVGTQLYKDNGLSNIVYLKETVAPLGEPSIVWSEVRETAVNGDETVTLSRKDVEWNIKTMLPWYLVDALTETPLLGDVRLRVAHGEGSDVLTNIRFDVQWESTCLAGVTMTFRVGDSSSSTGCCDKYDREPELSCAVPGAVRLVIGESCFEEGSFVLAWNNTTTGFYSYSYNGGPAQTLNTSVDLVGVPYLGPGVYCVWPSDEEGGFEGQALEGVNFGPVQHLEYNAQALESVSGTTLGFVWQGCADPIQRIIVPPLNGLEGISIINDFGDISGYLIEFLPGPYSNLFGISLGGFGGVGTTPITVIWPAALPAIDFVDLAYNTVPASVDALVASIIAGNPAAVVTINDFGADVTPTSASQAGRQALYDNGSTLPASWLTDLVL